ncbi:hypothetical protein PR048_018655 [Dryococelus australis]|uniref:DDE-1 domain-containing protein n=1 Tax=Dryococelus australis TaxID=614101 RepID=A0ABQ9HCV6_9NEOP|nr:hypothetical protein PR048_018655 [Dryococelus australis]
MARGNKKKEKEKRKQWDAAVVEMAISQARENNMGYLKAGKVFGITRTALLRLARTAVSPERKCTVVFTLLESDLNEHKYPVDRVYNVDETGATIVQSKIPQVFALKGKRQVASISSAEHGSLVTVVTFMRVGGDHVLLMLVFPRKNMSPHLMRGAPPGAIGVCHPSGWIQSYLFTQWFCDFLGKVKPTAESPVLLILDGHYSYSRNLDVLNKARTHNVFIVCRPPHSSHKLQPLDKTFMSPLK